MGNCESIANFAITHIENSQHERESTDEPTIFMYDTYTGRETLRVQRFNDRFEIKNHYTRFTWRDEAGKDVVLLAQFIRSTLPLDKMQFVVTNFGTHSYLLEGNNIAVDEKNRYLQPSLLFAMHVELNKMPKEK